jgi:hypothetical protein
MNEIKSKFKIRRGYYINKDKVRTQKSYGGFSLPKSLLSYTGWKHGDLIRFDGLTSVIMMKRVHTKEQLEKLKGRQGGDYNREWCKKISKVGGDRETLGFKTFPERLISEYNLKDDQIIYFLPATATYLGGKDPDSKEVVFIAFDEKGLRELDKLPEEDNEKENCFFKRRMGDKEHYNLRLYTKKTEMIDKNTNRSKMHFKKVIEETLPNDAIERIESQIEKMKKEVEEYKLGKLGTERNRKSIIRSLKKSIKNFKGIVKEIKKDLKIVYYPELRNKNVVSPEKEAPNKGKWKKNNNIWGKFKKEKKWEAKKKI